MFAFMIMTSARFENVRRMMRWIYRPENFYVISIDLLANSSMSEEDLQALDKPNIKIVRPCPVTWGGISQVTSLFNGMRTATEMGQWRYFINLSDTDVPIKSLSAISAQLDQYAQQGKLNFVRSWGMTTTPKMVEMKPSAPPELEEMMAMRPDVKFLVHRQLANMFSSSKSSPVMEIKWRVSLHVTDVSYQKTLIVRPLFREEAIGRMKFFARHRPHFGKMWSILHRDTCEWMLNYEQLPEFFLQFGGTFCPDESMLHTLLNSEDNPHRDTIMANAFRFNKASPIAINDHVLPKLQASEDFFARKLSQKQTTKLEAWLDKLAAQ